MHVQAKKLILATGVTENAVSFPGWDLPGVMGAGAAQTMINVHRVLPGKRVIMLGSGNVGVIVAYQLLKAGADVAAIVEASPRLGGNIPLHDEHMRSSLPYTYVAGDIAGLEEASTAMEEGRMAANHARFALQRLSLDQFGKRHREIRNSLDSLRTGMFGQWRRESKEYILESNRGGIPWIKQT